MPPANLADFAHQLLLAAETHPGCLSHLQHAVRHTGLKPRTSRQASPLLMRVGLALYRCGAAATSGGYAPT